MGVIKQLKQFITGTNIFPITKTNAVYDDTVGRLDTFMQNILVGADTLEGETEDTPRDADRLGGQLPEYFAKQSDLNELNSNLEWKLLGRFKLNETLTLPDNWKELYFISSKTETAANGICGVIYNLGLTTTAHKLTFNGHIASNNGQALSFMVSTDSIMLNQYMDNGTTTVTNGICDVYYR